VIKNTERLQVTDDNHFVHTHIKAHAASARRQCENPGAKSLSLFFCAFYALGARIDDYNFGYTVTLCFMKHIKTHLVSFVYFGLNYFNFLSKPKVRVNSNCKNRKDRKILTK
jgi:hypothetical protein